MSTPPPNTFFYRQWYVLFVDGISPLRWLVNLIRAGKNKTPVSSLKRKRKSKPCLWPARHGINQVLNVAWSMKRGMARASQCLGSWNQKPPPLLEIPLPLLLRYRPESARKLQFRRGVHHVIGCIMMHGDVRELHEQTDC